MQELDAPGAPARDEIAVVPLSDPGRVRTENQDALAVLENTSRERLILIADGMGGHRGGETASRICLQIVERVFREPHGTPEQRLRRGLELANEEIYSHALANPELKGMGTTAVVALLRPDRNVWVAWVGDSRCYRLRNGALESLTRDHSLMAEWIAMGVISPDAAQTHPRRHELTRALGQSPDVTVDLLDTELRPGDRLLLCSDGLHGCVADRALKHALAHGGPAEAARALIDAANAAGGSDNVTVIVVALPIEAVNMPAGAAGPEPAALLVPEVAHAREVMLDLDSTSELTAPLDPPAPPSVAVAAELDLFAPTADLRVEPPVEIAEMPAPVRELVSEPEPLTEPLTVPLPLPEPLPEPEPVRESFAPPEPAPEADVSFADLDDEIAEVVAEAPMAAEPAPVERALPPPAGLTGDLLPPSEQHIQIPLMTPVRASRRRGLDVTSVVAGVGGTLVIAALGVGVWLYTGPSRSPASEAAAQPRPAIARPAPAVPAPAPVVPAPEPARPPAPAVAPVAPPQPAPAVAPALAPAPAVAPAPAPAPVAIPAPAPVVEPVVVAKTAPARPAAAETAPAAPDPAAATTLPTSRGFELPAPVTRFVDDWLRALSTHDHALLASLGFPDEPAAFAGTARTRDGYRLVAAELDEERSHGGRFYLRVVVSYAFRDASGRFRTQDEQRFILRDVQGRLRFEGGWQQ